MPAEQRRRGRISAEEAGRAGGDLAAQNRMLHRDVMATEAPRPRALRVGFTEYLEPVHLWVPSTSSAPVHLPVLDLVEHVLQAHDGGRGDIAGLGQARRYQLHRAVLLVGTHLAMRRIRACSSHRNPSNPIRYRTRSGKSPRG